MILTNRMAILINKEGVEVKQVWYANDQNKDNLVCRNDDQCFNMHLDDGSQVVGLI